MLTFRWERYAPHVEVSRHCAVVNIPWYRLVQVYRTAQVCRSVQVYRTVQMDCPAPVYRIVNVYFTVQVSRKVQVRTVYRTVQVHAIV